MKRILISKLENYAKEKVKLKGWIHNIKKFSNFSFVTLRDQTGLIQLVINNDLNISELKLEMSVEVTGKVVENEKAINGVEVQVEKIEILGKTYYDLLPFSINGKEINTTLERQLDYRTISLRKVEIRSIFKIQQEIIDSFRRFLLSRDFNEIKTPKIIGSETEGGSEVFMVDYFGARTFLAQSPQFYKQMMVGAGFERVFEIGHAYRAELHNTWRHLNEYISLDVEMGFIENEFDLMKLEEEMLKYIIEHISKVCVKELCLLKIELPEISEIPKITFEDVQNILLDVYDKKKSKGNIDAEGEQLISKFVKDKYDSDFVFITKYPKSKRPMYTMPDNEEEKTKSFDLIFRGLEITTGGQRIHDYKMLMESINKFGCNDKQLSFYTDTFKYGMPPHGGFAIGLERLTMMLLGLKNIREASLFPRDKKRIMP